MKKNKEITLKSILLGILLSMLLASANAYLGLFAGMTVSASIPAAVISMGVLRFFKNHSILENNIVQTAASAGESLAAGVIFTIPALILMGYWIEFDYWEIAKISGIGGLLGVLFTIPLRKALIVEAKLKFPEGIATSEILKMGYQSDSTIKKNGLKILKISGLIGGLIKLAQQGLSLWHSSIEGAIRIGKSIIGFGCDLSPALIGVGYIVGRNISILVFSGGIISWAIAIPIYSSIYGIEGNALDSAWKIWNNKIRYLGVGAMIVGGIWSLIKLFNPLYKGLKSSINSRKISNPINNDNDIPINYIFLILMILLIPLFYVYYDVVQSFKIAIVLTFIMLFFGFLFSSVASYMAGIVGFF